MAADARQSILTGMACWALGVIAILAFSISMADGRLVYTLDDPYIHLAVAETILQGGYGVNGDEFSSPSSSILYPFLLAATEAAGLGVWGPLAITLLSAGASVWITLTFLFGSVFDGVKSRAYPMAFAILLLFVQSAFALPFTGMEHSLHVLLAVVAVVEIIRFSESGRVSLLLLGAVIAMPLVRFEGLAYSGAILLVLAWSGRWITAAATGAAIAASLGAYATLMTALGLPVIPSSVSLKSPLAASSAGGDGLSGAVDAVTDNLVDAIGDPAGVFLICGAIAVIVLAGARSGWRPRMKPAWIVGAPCLLAVAGHVLAGDFGWFHRYEVYILAILSLTLTWLCRDAIREAVDGKRIVGQVASLAVLAIAAAPYAMAAIQTPAAARGTYDQQYQMHRLATGFWTGPVAVNDLGYVSYRNDAHVLDLWGLGSEEVRKARLDMTLDAGFVAGLVDRHGVGLAMIYPQWFEGVLPAEWRRIAVMRTATVTAAFGDVHIYATDAARVADVCEAVARFAATTPDRVRFETPGCTAG